MVDIFSLGTRKHDHRITAIILVEAGGRLAYAHTAKNRGGIDTCHHVVLVRVVGVELVCNVSEVYSSYARQQCVDC